MFSLKHLLAIGITSALLTGTAHAQSSLLNGQVVFGINPTNASLVRYDATTGTVTVIGTVHNAAGQSLTGINAASYFDGFQNIYAFWTNNSDNKNKLVYVDVTTGVGTVVAEDLEGGKFTGAARFSSVAKPYVVYAMQAAKIKPPQTISGSANINPNNSNANEFSLTKDTGAVITRDDLLRSQTVQADGTLYKGAATLVHIKPKGNGNQNSLMIDGKAFALQNANTYDFSGSMQVRLYNDKVSGNLTAMGQWWIEILSGTVYVNNDVQVVTPNRITSVDQKTGTVTEVMRLTNTYSGLSTTDGVTFFALKGNDLYKIDTVAGTETKVGSTNAGNNAGGLTFFGSTIMAYDPGPGSIVPINPTNGNTAGQSFTPGMGGVGPILITPKAQDPNTLSSEAYD